ncbi:MAG: hypothetical protein JST50_14065 [Bacteroidetes bacterium]|jgi:hypothetical protein|nr:hypothetical protein [Bacteroidota bacterium]
MKSLIVIIGLAIIASKSNAQQNLNNDANHRVITTLSTSQFADSIRTQILANTNKQGLAQSPTEKFGDHMPVMPLKKEDQLPVYYSETNDKMPIKYYRSPKSDTVKNNFFVPVQVPKITIPTPSKVTIK